MSISTFPHHQDPVLARGCGIVPQMDKGHEATEAERAREASVEKIKTRQPTLAQAFSTVSLKELANITEIPCARSSLLYGVVSSIAIGGVKFVLQRRGAQALNWGAATFAAVSLASFEGCRWQRFQERSRMKYAVDRVEIRRRDAKNEDV